MKRKYYLRGLGIGIFFTALILGVSFSNRKGISDEEVIKRAKELGLVESTYLNNVATKPEPESKPEAESGTEEPIETKPAKEPETEPAKETEANPSNTEAEEFVTEESTQSGETEKPEESTESVATEDEFVTLEIIRGDSSTKVAQKLEELGVIEDYKAFDRYLGKNGYDVKIKAKTYQIPTNATEEEIAIIITK